MSEEFYNNEILKYFRTSKLPNIFRKRVSDNFEKLILHSSHNSFELLMILMRTFNTQMNLLSDKHELKMCKGILITEEKMGILFFHNKDPFI